MFYVSGCCIAVCHHSSLCCAPFQLSECLWCSLLYKTGEHGPHTQHSKLAVQVLLSIYIPLLTAKAGLDKRSVLSSTLDHHGPAAVLNEFLLDLNKFAGQVGQTMHEVRGVSCD